MKHKNPTILVVDDEPNDLFFMKSAFKAIGVESGVRALDSGQEALSYLEGKGKYADRGEYPYPDFVITDLKMPVVDGFGVIEYLRKNPDYAITPTVILSGSQDNEDIRKAYRLGASSYLVKPSSTKELRTLLKILHDYWMACETPEVDVDGRQLVTDDSQKLGKRYSIDPSV